MDERHRARDVLIIYVDIECLLQRVTQCSARAYSTWETDSADVLPIEIYEEFVRALHCRKCGSRRILCCSEILVRM